MKPMKKLIAMLVVVIYVLMHTQLVARAAPSENDIWKLIGVDPQKRINIEDLNNTILATLVSIIRLLNTLAIPVAIIGALIGALTWGIGAITQNERTRKAGIVTIITVCFVPVLAKIAPIIVAAFASSLR